MALSDIDRSLLERCLAQKPRAWEDFVDRFLGLVVHVVNHTAQSRSVRLSVEDREDLCADVFLELLRNDFSVLRNFRGHSSLATYLAVVSRRVVVHRLLIRRSPARLATGDMEAAVVHASAEERLLQRDEVERLLDTLHGAEAEVVRLYHIEGKSYHEISAVVGMPENSIGPVLSRARSKMRRASVNS